MTFGNIANIILLSIEAELERGSFPMKEEHKKHLLAFVILTLLIISAILCAKAVYWMLWAVLALLGVCLIAHFAAAIYKNAILKQQLSSSLTKRLEPVADKILELTGFISSLPQAVGGPTVMLLSTCKNVIVVLLNKLADKIKNKSKL